MLRHLPAALKPGGRFLAMDFAAHGHSILGHLLAIVGHARGERMIAALPPLLTDAGSGDGEAIPTRHASFAFIRAR